MSAVRDSRRPRLRWTETERSHFGPRMPSCSRRACPLLRARAAIGNLYHEFFTTMGVKELVGTPSRVEMARSADLAYETGVNRIVVRTPNGDMLDMGKYLIVWKKINGQWYVAALSFTSDAAAPTPIPSK